MSEDARDRSKKINALDELVKEIGSYTTGPELMELFNFIRKFPKMSPYNLMLTHVQKPGSEFVASAWEWREKYRRTIKPGARPLVILRQFGPVEFVFELGDTEGEPFPQQIFAPFAVKGTIEERTYERLIQNLTCYGIALYDGDYGTSSGGEVQQPKKSNILLLETTKRIYHITNTYTLVVNRNLSRESRCATIFHELGHIFCGHAGVPPVSNFTAWTPRRHVVKAVREFEAEAVAWLVCERLGIENPSARYLSGYLSAGQGERLVQEGSTVDAILKAAGMVEAMLRRSIAPLKALVVRVEQTAETASAARNVCLKTSRRPVTSPSSAPT